MRKAASFLKRIKEKICKRLKCCPPRFGYKIGMPVPKK
jgi:hypothetical protein